VCVCVFVCVCVHTCVERGSRVQVAVVLIAGACARVYVICGHMYARCAQVCMDVGVCVSVFCGCVCAYVCECLFA
jgi:hypothetical protein